MTETTKEENVTNGRPRLLSTEEARFLLIRCVLDEMRLPRICVNRNCRRHKHCADTDLTRAPRCTKSIDPVDGREAQALLDVAIGILDGTRPPVPADDPVEFDRERLAITLLSDFNSKAAGWHHHLLAWARAYTQIVTARYWAVMKAKRETAASSG